MKRIIFPLVIIFVGAFLVLSSCKRNSTVGAIGDPMEGDFPVFDTFKVPDAKYYFYGRFDGHIRTWSDSLRSKWDTARRLCIDPEMPWTACPLYNENIYYNFTSSGEALDTCPFMDPKDGSVLWFNRTRFIRPEIADQRLDIYFYDCVNSVDISDPNFPINNVGMFKVGSYPFSNENYGRNGVEVVFTDKFRDRWSTRFGSGQPQDTYFRITDFQAIPAADSTDTLGLFWIEGELAGRLFHEQSGDEMILTEAKFKMRVIPDTSNMVP